MTSPLVPELVTCGSDLADAFAQVADALATVLELYDDFRRPLPPGLQHDAGSGPLGLEYVPDDSLRA